MRLNREFTVGNRILGHGQPPVLLPDIGTYFNQDLDLAFQLIDQVSAAGLEFIKGEVLHNSKICLDLDFNEVITDRDLKVYTERYKQVIDRKVLSFEEYKKIFSYAQSKGLQLALSIYDFSGLQFALEMKVSLVKIASSNIVHYPLISAVGKTKVPTILDTGRSTLDEIARAVKWFVESGGENLIIQHSPPAPPAPVKMQNLGFMEELKEVFDCPIGLSDHHFGDEMLYAATALGFSVLEKGVCPDNVLREQDLAHSLPISQLSIVTQKCANIYAATHFAPESFAPPTKHPARMGLIAKKALNPGKILTPEDIEFAFPAIGIPVENWNEVLGTVVKSEVKEGKPILYTNLE